jgi:hypothetical protein
MFLYLTKCYFKRCSMKKTIIKGIWATVLGTILGLLAGTTPSSDDIAGANALN